MRFLREWTWALVAACVASGCGPNSAELGGERVASDATTLTVMMEPDGRGAWRELFDRFEAANPGIEVRLVEGPTATDSREDLYVNALLSGSGDYDLIYADVIWVPKFAAAGWLEDLTDYWDEWDEFVDASVDGATVGGRIYRVPVQMNGGLLYYRKDLLAQHGIAVPRTFEELRAASMRLQAAGMPWGFVWQGKQYEGLVCDYLEVLEGFGGTWIDPDTMRIGLEDPEAREALAFLADAVGTISPPGVTTYAEEESRLLYQGGDAVFLRNWPYVYKILAAEGSELLDKTGIAPMPSEPGGRPTSTLGGAGFAIAKSSPAKAEAWKLIEFVASPESVRFMNDRIGLQPARKDFYTASTDPMQAELFTVLSHTSPRPQIPQYAQASDILQRWLSAAITGQTSPEEALARAAEETRLLLGRRRIEEIEAGGAR